MANEIFDIDLFLLGSNGSNGLLSGDSVLNSLVTGVFPDLAPQDQPTPYIIYSLQSSQDLSALGAVRILTDDNILIKAIDQSENYSTVKPITQRLEELLQTAKFIGENAVLSFRRSGAIRYPETVSGKSYRHSGAIWQTFAQPFF